MTKKRLGLMAVIFLLVLVLAAYSESRTGELKDDLVLERNEAGAGDKEIILHMQAEGLPENYEYHLTLEEIKLTQEEAYIFLDEVIDEIEKAFEQIENQIPMEKTYHDGLVEATWSFDKANCIDIDGNIINEEIPEEGQLVNATVMLTCQEYEKVHFFSFLLEKKTMTESEKFLKELDVYVETQMQEAGAKEFTLPSEINGISIIWQDEKEYLVLKVLFLEIVVVILLLISQVEKKKEKEKLLRQELEFDYPEIVGQIHILIGAGMTIPQAWNRITMQYLQKRKKGVVKIRAAYEELVYINRRMIEGESEKEALRHMHKRITVSSYHRLIRILLNNKDKGTADLCQALEQEAASAYEQRVLMAKKRGEEASTKMLVPLMFMMVLVMIIVMLPAMIEFAG